MLNLVQDEAFLPSLQEASRVFLGLGADVDVLQAEVFEVRKYGASGYLAVMALASFEPSVMKPTALTLNLIVSLVATAMFFWKGHFRWRLFWPFAVVAVPFAFIGGGWQVRNEVFHLLVAGALVFAIVRLLLPGAPKRALRRPPWWAILLSASTIGLVSGLIGVGGGIFLTPLLLLFGWARPATAAAVSAPFIFVNSAAGLAGHGSAVANLPSYWPLLACAVLAGGIIGAQWGSAIARPVLLRRALAGRWSRTQWTRLGNACSRIGTGPGIFEQRSWIRAAVFNGVIALEPIRRCVLPPSPPEYFARAGRSGSER